MIKLKIDIFGKAPSLQEIEWYNVSLLKNYHLLGKLLLLMIVVEIGLVVFFVEGLYIYNQPVHILVLFLLFIPMMIVGATREDELEKKENFILPSECTKLANLINKYPEVAAYRAQVVAQGREFLQREYEACIKVIELRAFKEIHGVNMVVPQF